MRYRTRELGAVEVSKDQVLCFTAPLLGFESFRKYALLSAGRDAKPFFVLQSLEEPQLAFPVVRAEELSLSYRGRAGASLLSAEDLRRVAAATPEEVTCWVVVAIPADGGPLRLNLRAPLIVNEKKQLAAQVVIGEERLGGAKWGDSEKSGFNGANSAPVGAAELPARPPSPSLSAGGQAPNFPVSRPSSVDAY